MWFLCSSDELPINVSGSRTTVTKFIVSKDNLTEFLSKNQGNWRVEQVPQWTLKMQIDNEVEKKESIKLEPLSR